MSLIKPLSILLFALIAIYTLFVIIGHGGDFITPFFLSLFAVDWEGQFILDFGMYLLLVALWIAWRHNYSAAGIAMAVASMFGGMMFFAIYLFLIARKSEGDPKRLFLGENRAREN